MEQSAHILNELIEAKSTLAQVKKVNPYLAPENYFSDFAAGVRSLLYVNSIGNSNPYQVEAEYFESFSNLVLKKIKENTPAILPGKISSDQLFTTPAFYFETFADTVLGKIKATGKSEAQLELEEISPFIAGIAKTNVYSVPEGYFNLQSAANVKQAAEQQPQPVKVISMKPKRNWLTYAAAACVVFVLGLAGLRYYNSEQPNKIQNISAYKNLSNVNVEQAIYNLSDDEINNYLDKQTSNAIDVNAPDNFNSLDVNDLIQNVSDQEIQQYLKEHSYDDGGGSGI